MGYNTATIGIVRDPNECMKEFECWLNKSNDDYTKASTIRSNYLRAKKGLTRVDCFCGRPAVQVRRTFDQDENGEPKGEKISLGLCNDHTVELVRCLRTVREIEGKAIAAFKDIPENTFKAGSGSID